MSELVDFAQTLGLPGVLVALVVIVGVFLAKRGGLVVNGNTARLANVILAAILSGLADTGSTDERAIVAAIASIVSALLFELYGLLEKGVLHVAQK